ncbi:MAG: hypothetical protein PWQ29_1272 [Verrucomicrobiota bacterium]|jgi:predicted nucleic acid-binding Zn ribbon protein|nr:hypothetical protein [Verrucomicrobiota bacterium]MDK2963878.1 hypothetical protein [Verrucomicrobiota bacterium]
MKPSDTQRLKWQLIRERFQIAESEPPRSRRPERRIGDILADLLNKNKTEFIELPDTLVERWPMIAGSQIAQHTHPAYLKRGLLYVHADHPGWLAEVRRLPKIHLLKKIAAIPNLPEIKDIRFQLDPAIRTFRN